MPIATQAPCKNQLCQYWVSGVKWGRFGKLVTWRFQNVSHWFWGPRRGWDWWPFFLWYPFECSNLSLWSNIFFSPSPLSPLTKTAPVDTPNSSCSSLNSAFRGGTLHSHSTPRWVYQWHTLRCLRFWLVCCMTSVTEAASTPSRASRRSVMRFLHLMAWWLIGARSRMHSR